MTSDHEGAPATAGRPLLRWTGALAVAGSLVVIGVASLVTWSVALRWVTSSGLSGDFELVQIGTALGVFAFLPFCQARRGNVAVDTFTTWLPHRAQVALDALWDLVYAAAAGVIAWRLAEGASDTLSSGTTSMVLGLPTGYAIAACAAMAAILAAVSVFTAVHLLKSGE